MEMAHNETQTQQRRTVPMADLPSRTQLTNIKRRACLFAVPGDQRLGLRRSIVYQSAWGGKVFLVQRLTSVFVATHEVVACNASGL